jgi:hypothetical protein
MTNFNYKKYLTENKLTQTTKLRAGILTEGQFSWMTQDTGQQIGSEEENMIPVYMYDDKGNVWNESNYDGYGEFGGMDYYELLDKMNGGEGDRSRGIDLAFDKVKTDSEILYPALVTRPNFDWKSHDFTKEAKHDPNQSWYMEPEEEDFTMEGKKGYYKDAEANDAEHIDALEKDMKDDKKSSLNEYEVIYYYEGSKCMSRNDEGEVMEVSMDKCRRFAQNENKESNKMKKSELKDKIKEMVLAEMNLDINDETPESEEDFLAEVDAILAEANEFDTNKPARIAEFIKALDMLVDEYHAELYLSDDLFSAVEMVKKAANEAINLNEAEDEVAVDDTEVAVDGEENIDVDTTVEVDPNVKAVQDALTQAQAAAQKLGDSKLTDQIGNTITFFTRAHVVEKGAVAEVDEMEENKTEDLNESMFPMLKRILK